MTRFACLLLLLAAGCQTAARGPQKTILVRHQNATASAKHLWSNTTKFLQPFKSENKNPAETETLFALNQVNSDILPINHTSHSLYKPGSIFLSPMLEFQEPDEGLLVAQHIEPQSLESESVDIAENSSTALPTMSLRIQSGDSEAFQSLLREIAVESPDRWKVDVARMSELLDLFRVGAMNTELEEEYIALIRRNVLPEPVAPRLESARHTELAANNRSGSRSGTRSRDWEDEYGDDYFDFDYEEPMPRRAPQQREQHLAHNSGPVYPNLPQLPGAANHNVAHGGVVQTSHQMPHMLNPAMPHQAMMSYGAGDWQAPMRQAIEQLRYAIEHTPHGRTIENEMRLRTSEAMLGNKAEAARPMQSADRTINNFMAHQVLGLAELLDDTTQNTRAKYTSAAYRFNEGLRALQDLCPIKLKNVTFVTAGFRPDGQFVPNVFGYGQFIPHPTQEFHPGEQFWVYMEFEHVTGRPVSDGFEYSLALNYEIRDVHGAVVERGGETTEMRSLTPRRDQNVSIPGAIPVSLAPGQYYLRISVTDLNDDSMQHAEEQIPFRIAPAGGSGL